MHQREPVGYGHVLYCARDFVRQDPCLHLVRDHLYVSATPESCAQRLVRVAEEQACAVSAVQATLENVLHHYGAISGGRMLGDQHVYRIETVIEKPTPTEAEQKLIVRGMPSGHYLRFSECT